MGSSASSLPHRGPSRGGATTSAAQASCEWLLLTRLSMITSDRRHRAHGVRQAPTSQGAGDPMPMDDREILVGGVHRLLGPLFHDRGRMAGVEPGTRIHVLNRVVHRTHGFRRACRDQLELGGVCRDVAGGEHT